MALEIDVVLSASVYDYRKVPTDKLSIDRRVQRAEPDPKVINKMVAEFDPDGLGTLVASLRPNGEIIVLDGQHRLETCRLVGYDRELDCKLFLDLWREGPELGLKAEARIFTLTNRHIKVGSVDSFRVAVTAGNAEAQALMDLLTSHGLVPRTGLAPSSFQAIATAMKVMRSKDGPRYLDEALKIAQEAWAGNRMALDGRLLEGMVAFLRRYAEQVKVDQLTDRLRNLGSNGPKDIIETAHTIRATVDSGPLRFATAQAILRLYNHGRSMKLPSWRVESAPATESDSA